MNLEARQANIDLTIHIAPLLRASQPPHQFLEGVAILRRVFEPGDEIEGFTQLPTVMQSPCNGRQIFEADGDVARLFLEDGATLVLGEGPPRLRLANGDERSLGSSRTRKPLLVGIQGVDFGTIGVARVARNAAQYPVAPGLRESLRPFENCQPVRRRQPARRRWFTG